MTADVVIHPASGLPDACDADGQAWLPPLWVWPTPPWRGSWEYTHQPEYLVAIGRAASIGEAMVMIGQMIEARINPEVLRALLTAVERGEL